MLTSRHVAIGTTSLILVLSLAACSGSPDDESSPEGSTSFTGFELKTEAAQGAQTRTQHIEFGYLSREFITCANGGAGEFVVLQGRFEGVVHETIDAQGKYHVGLQIRPALVEGTGETTGDRYRLVGAFHDQFSGEGPAQYTFTHDLKIVAPGPNNDAILTFRTFFSLRENGLGGVGVGGGVGAVCR